MKRLLLALLLFGVPLFAQSDHTLSWPTLETGIAVPDSFAIVQPGSNDKTGKIVLWTGAGCCRQGGRGSKMRVMLVTYGKEYDKIKYPILTPANGDTAALSGDRSVFVAQYTATARNFEIGVNWMGLEPGFIYEWNYVVPD